MYRISFVVLVLSIAAGAHGAEPSIKTYKVPMRDGVRLATDICLPSADAKDLPCILVRTPYDRKRFHRENGSWSSWGYAVAIQDVRGRYDSEGKAVAFESDGWGKLQDGYDTIAWLRKQSFCNGKVGTSGASAMGITQLLTAPTNPPGLLCQYVLLASASSYHHGTYVGGAFRKSQVEGWLKGNGFDPDALKRVLSNPLYNEEWKPFNTLAVSNKVRVPAIHFGGWFDTFSQGTIDAFAHRQTRGGDGARGRQKLIMGPWTHGGHRRRDLGEFPMPPEGGKLPVDVSARNWFDHWLKGVDNGIDRIPAVSYYVMGPFDGSPSGGNVWRSADAWPIPARRTEWFASEDGALSPDAGPATSKLEYRHDPDNPCPTIGGRNLNLPAGPRDQRPIEKRNDLLVFTSEALESEIEVTGRVTALVALSSDRRDTDVAVRLCDVYPDGRSVLIADGIRRAALSDDDTEIEMLASGEVRVVEVDLWATSIVFAKGHRVRMSISGSNYPRWESSTNTVLADGRHGSKEVARNTVHLGGDHSTRIVLPVVARDENGVAIAFEEPEEKKEEPEVTRSAEQLFAKSRWLAKKGRYGECLEAMKDAFVLRLPEYRDREFKHPVHVNMMSEEKLRAYFVEMLKTEYPDEEFEKDRLVMTHMGFMKPGVALKELMVDVYSENIAGFYDTDTKQLFLIAEPPPKPGAKKRSLWSRVFGSDGGFDWSGNRSVISHELAHALADQQFDLHSLHGSVEADEDMTMALSALIEGEAMLVMILDATEPKPRERADALRSMVASSAIMNLLVSATAGLAGGKSFRRAPLIFRESMIFPYTQGQAFCATLAATGNWRGVDRAFKSPPVSTEQILHPEKWIGDTIDMPVALTFKKDVPLDASRWELVDQNVAGEFATGVLLRPYLGRARSVRASAGWDGDTYRLYRDTKAESDRTTLVWTSTWDSETDASEFASALWQLSQKRGARERRVFQVAGAKVEDGQLFTRDVGVSAIWRESTHVWLIDQAEAADLDELVSWSRDLDRGPKRFVFKKTESKVSFPEE